MDNLVEQLVKRKKGVRYYINMALILIVAILIPVTFVIIAEFTKRAYFIYIAFFTALFCIYGAWYFITSLSIEFEYAVLGSVFRVDKIIAKRRRKKVLKIDVKELDDVFKYSEKEMNSRSFTKIYYVGYSDYDEENYVASFNSEAKGRCAIVFSPKEKLLSAIKPYLKREIVSRLFN